MNATASSFARRLVLTRGEGARLRPTLLWKRTALLFGAIYGSAACSPAPNDAPPGSCETARDGEGHAGCGPGGGWDGRGGDAPLPPPETYCEELRVPPEPAPLAVGFLIDRSVSMATPEGKSKWELARAALLSFSDRAELTGLEVALQLFPARFSEACSELSYEDPIVPFGAAPHVAADLKLALAFEGPGGPNSPLEPALKGHSAYLKGRRAERSTSQVVSVLLTDGLPSGCGSAWESTLDIVRASAEIDGIPTFVVALGQEQNLARLRELAAAGRGEVLFVDVERRGAAALTEAFGKIREDVSACELTLPRLGVGRLVPESVRLRFTGGRGVESWPLLDRPERCAGDNEGFFYEGVDEPRRLRLCPHSCERVQSARPGVLELDVACVEIVR